MQSTLEAPPPLPEVPLEDPGASPSGRPKSTFSRVLRDMVPALAAADWRAGFDELELPAHLQRAVIVHHIFRNALIGVEATLGFTFVGLVSEAVVTETVFSLPGIGRLVVQSILRRDYPVIQGVILVIIVFYILVNLVVDIVTTYLDPRVKLS